MDQCKTPFLYIRWSETMRLYLRYCIKSITMSSFILWRMLVLMLVLIACARKSYSGEGDFYCARFDI